MARSLIKFHWRGKIHWVGFQWVCNRGVFQSKEKIVIHSHIVLRVLCYFLNGGQLINNRISQHCLKRTYSSVHTLSYKRTQDDNYTNILTLKRVATKLIYPTVLFLLPEEPWLKTGR